MIPEQKIKTEKISLPVEGMTCASCVMRVEKALSKVEGIKDVSVNFATEKASFTFDPDTVDVKTISSVVEDAGYKIDVSSFDKNDSGNKKEENQPKSEFERNLRNDLILSVVLTIPVLILSMGNLFNGFSRLIPLSQDNINKILLILTIPVVFISGKRFFKVFWKELLHFRAEMNSLVAIGTGAAFTVL